MCLVQAAKECDTPSRTREAWRLGSALNQAGRLEEAEPLFRVSLPALLRI